MKRLIGIIILTGFVFMMLFNLVSCSVLKKTVTRTDSTVVKNIDSSKVLKSDSVSSKKVDSTYERETTIELYPSDSEKAKAVNEWLNALARHGQRQRDDYLKLKAVADSMVRLGYSMDTSYGNFYLDPMDFQVTNPNDFAINDRVAILAAILNKPVAKITIKERGVLLKNDETKVSKIDSAKVKSDEKVSVKKVEKEKKVMRFPWWVLLLLIIPIAYYLYKRKILKL